MADAATIATLPVNVAEDQLGPKFDVRTFHDAVLADGAVPLDVLEANVKAYIERTASKNSAGTTASRSQPSASSPITAIE